MVEGLAVEGLVNERLVRKGLLCQGLVHEGTGRGEFLAGLDPGFEPGQDHRPTAVELFVGTVGELIVGHGESARIGDWFDLPSHA